jgi:hypothetical protein
MKDYTVLEGEVECEVSEAEIEHRLQEWLIKLNSKGGNHGN